MRLEDYKEHKELSYRQLAIKFNLTASLIHRVCRGEGTISLAAAAKIVLKTKGEVTYEDLLPVEETV